MLREMTSGQLDEWIAFQKLEPWGLEVLDSLVASVKATILNVNRSKKKPPVKDLKGLLLWPDKPRMIDAELDDEDDL